MVKKRGIKGSRGPDYIKGHNLLLIQMRLLFISGQNRSASIALPGQTDFFTLYRNQCFIQTLGKLTNRFLFAASTIVL